MGNGVAGFTLNPNLGEFVLTHPDLHVPADTHEFAINSSNSRFWEPPVKRYVDECLAGKPGPRGKDFNMRWIASMVAEAHRILMRGGVFMYPRDTKDPAKPGRLRLLYEANPIGFVMEQAGGRASTGRQPVLGVQADHAAPAHRPGVRFEERGGAHRALPPRTAAANDDRYSPLFAERSLFLTCLPEPLSNFTGHPPCPNATPSSPSPASVRRRHHQRHPHLREHLPARERAPPPVIEGDSFHRYDRKEMRQRQAEAEKAGNKHFSHFGPENNLFAELEQLFRATPRPASAGAASTCTTPWKPRPTSRSPAPSRPGKTWSRAPTCCSTKACTAA